MKVYLKILSFFLFIINTPFIYAQSSVLSTGEWHKIEVATSGVYKIDYNFLVSIGFQDKDPQTIKVYGYGGILPQSNEEFRYGDLVENNIYFNGEDDGGLDAGDYLLFYGQGPDEIYEDTDGSLTHEVNPYAQSSYYFITSGGDKGKRVTYEVPTVDVQNSFSTLPYLTYLEDENVSIIESGREWYGESFKFVSEKSFSIDLKDINTGSAVDYTIRYVAGSEDVSTSFTTYLNNDFISTKSVSTVSDGYGTKGRSILLSGEKQFSDDVASIKSIFNNNGDANAIGYLDYIQLTYQRILDGSSSTCYTVPSSYTESQVSIANISSNTLIWDVSKVNDIQGVLSVDGKVKLGAEVTKLLVLNKNNFNTPQYIGQVENQNLHNLTIPELVIVTHSSLRSSADEFADFKRNVMGIETQVVEIGQVYNEYSSGSMDVSALRDFMRDLYQRDGGLKYLLLYGDCSYDFKDRLSDNTNLVPVYQSRESLNNVKTFSSDDYFGMLEDSEGYWKESTTNGTLEIGIGRFPITTNSEGIILKEKIEHYINSNDAKSNWRNRILFVADDEDGNDHMEDAIDLNNLIATNEKTINTNTLFLDSYEQISSSGGQIAPSVNEEFDLKLDRGVLIVNYSGHGSEEKWTQEGILDINQINNLDNLDKMPFLLTATCEFGRYDDPVMQSGAERFLLNENGGAIGLMTTTRPVYANTNLVLNKAFYNNVFLRNSDSLFDNLGDVHMRTKNESMNSYYNRNFSLLGDPSIKLAYPSNKVFVDSINSSSVLDTIRALEEVQVIGHVSNQFGVKDVSFNGTVSVTIYDKSRVVKTLGDKDENPFSFSERTSVVFEGDVVVTNGSYLVDFVVPKDISYSYGEGKMSFYALDNEGNEASGYFDEFIIGGGLDGFEDVLAPDLELFVDDYTFVDGGITGTDPLFIANIFDENGVNTTNTGIGHEMTLTIDGDLSNLYVLNDFYKSVDNTYQKGLIEYPLYDLSLGLHQLTLKVWDVNNNSAEQDIWIIVSEEGIVQAFPNPFSEEVTFRIDQPRLDVGGSMDIKIYNNLGVLVWSEDVDFDEFTTIVDDVVWDGRDNNGEYLSSGIYFVVSDVRYNDSIGNFTENSKVTLQK